MTAKWVDYGLSFLPQSTPACRAVLMICRCRSSESQNRPRRTTQERRYGTSSYVDTSRLCPAPHG